MLPIKDEYLLKRLIQNDEGAFKEFYLDNRGSLLQYLKRKLDHSDAEEVLQDSFIAFIEALRNFERKSSLKTFLYSIAKRKAIDKLRKTKVKKILFSYIPEHIIESLAMVFLKDDLDRKILEKKIEAIFSKLPNDYAQILRLKYKEGYRVKEIAQTLQISGKATESLLYRARKAFIQSYELHERQGIFSIKEALS